MATSNKHMFTFLKLLWLTKCHHNWFLKKLKFTIILFYFLCVMTCLSLTLCKKCFNSQNGWEKTSYPGISAEGYQQKHEMKVASKNIYWKNNSVPNTCNISPLKTIFFSELSRCIFQISLKYIKLVVPKILFILVLCNLNFYFKITWPLTNKITLTPNNITPPSK